MTAATGSRSRMGRSVRPRRRTLRFTPAEHDLDPEAAARAVRYLMARDLYWDIIIDNVALNYDTGTRQELRLRFDFKG